MADVITMHYTVNASKNLVINVSRTVTLLWFYFVHKQVVKTIQLVNPKSGVVGVIKLVPV